MYAVDVYEWDLQNDIVSNSIPVDEPGRDGMFKLTSDEVSSLGVGFTVTGQPRISYDVVMLFDVAADTVSIDAGGQFESFDIRYEDALSDDFQNQSRVLYVGFSLRSGPVSVTLSANARPCHCGFFVVGRKTDLLGCLLYGSTTGIVDYSKKDRDPFGEIQIIERGFTNWFRYEVRFDETRLELIRDYLASRRVTLTAYVGDETMPETWILGWYRDFQIPIDAWNLSLGYIDVESVVYDKPAYWSEYRAVFGTYGPSNCDYGQDIKTVELIGGIPQEAVQVAVEDYPTVAPATVEWIVKTITGETPNLHGVRLVTTPCGDLTVWEWPTDAPVSQTGWQVSLTARITFDPEAIPPITVLSQPAILTVQKRASECPCTEDIYPPAWWNYDLDIWGGTSEAGLVDTTIGMVELFDRAPVGVSSAGEDLYFWVDLPGSLAWVEFRLTTTSGTATMYAELWVPCGSNLPSERSDAFSDTTIRITVSFDDKDKYRAALVRLIPEGAFTGTIEAEWRIQGAGP